MEKIVKIILFLFAVFMGSISFGQTESINTDRPDQSDGVYTIPKNRLQLENGITIADKIYFNNFMLRYGLTESTELRLLIDAGKEDSEIGIKPLTFSIKQRISDRQNILPAITLVGYISLPKFASRAFQEDEIPFELKLAFENELNDEFSIGYNIGASDKFKQLNLTFGIGYSPFDKVSTFVEYFSSFTKLNSEQNIDLGVLYAVTPNLQIDIAAGHSINDVKSRFFTTFGISYLFN